MTIRRSNPGDLLKVSGISQITRVGNFVFTAGQVAVDNKGNLVGHQDPEAQLRRAWSNIELACRSAGGGLEDLVKTTTFITSPDAFAAVSKVRTEMFGEHGPANSTIIVAALARPEWLVEIEAIAYVESAS